MADLITKTRALIGEIKEGIRYWFRYDGRPPYPEAGSPDPVEREDRSLERQFEISKSIPAFAGLEIVNPSTLWVSAYGFEDPESGAKHEPQVIFPPNKEGGDEEQLAFAREIFDTYLKRDGVNNIIEQMFYSGARYGRFVQEIGWIRGETKEFGDKIFPEYLRDCPPQFYLKDPEGYDPGIYRKDTMYNYKNLERMPDNRFVWGTFYKYFENPYGISLMSLLDNIEEKFGENFKDWLTGNKRAGTGTYYAHYGARTGRSQESRDQLLEQLKKLRANMVGIIPDDAPLNVLESAIQSDSFRDAHKAIIELYSLLITGSPTTLKESEYGSYGREESQNTRRHSQKQKYYANIISHALTTQLVWPAIDFNYENVEVYPWVQIIAPEYISPIVAKDERDPKEEEEPNNDRQEEDRRTDSEMESEESND